MTCLRRASAFGFIWLLLSVTLSPGQDTFTPQHVAKLRIVTSVATSPDGNSVAYLLSVPRDLAKEKDGPSWSELHVVDTGGKGSTPYITGAVNIDAPTWSADSQRVFFLTKREKDETRSLYSIPIRGGEAKKVLAHSTDIHSYSFSGDGKRVAFLAHEPVAKAKKARQEQGFNQEIYEEDQPLTRIWTASLDDGKPATMVKVEGSASELHWNPNDDTLAVALAKNALIDDSLMFRKVHVIDLKTGKATDLGNEGKMTQMAWSPDGKQLALISGADKHDPKDGRLLVHTVGKPGWKDFAIAKNGHVESIGWEFPGVLCYQSAHGIQTNVGLVGTQPNNVFDSKIDNRKVIFGHISVPSLGAPLIAGVGQSPNHPPEVYRTDGDKAPLRLTDSNPWLKDMKLAEQEVIKYKARDGLELEGVLIRPLNEKKGERYPLVLTVHGGPEAHCSNGWLTNYNMLGQVAAARGMCVFYPNYRGSTGYGVEFSMKGQRDAGGKEFDDLVDGVDHLIKLGLVDKAKVGITGGSYGGYATAWGATYYSDRFAAGVMFVGVSDWISCSGTTDIPHEMHLVHHRKWLWEDWDYFAKSSPIFHVEKSKTPLLILHGKSDPRVHPSQSMELYRHLKVRGKAPVRLVLYPGEGHGNRRTASRLDYNLRLLQWMEHYLKGPGGAMPPYEIDHGVSPPAKTGATSWDRPERLTSTPWPHRGCPCCLER